MSAETYVEDNPIILPVLEDKEKLTVKRLGDLWNCNESKYVGQNLFIPALDGEYINATPDNKDVYNFIHCKSAFDKIKKLEVGGEISIELLSGAISVKGSGNYNSNETETKNTEQMTCYCRKQKFDVEALDCAKNIINNTVREKILNKTLKATHFVGRITLGAEVNADILVTQNDKSSKTDIKGDFFGKIIYGPVDASVKANLTFLDKENDENFKKEINVHSMPSIGEIPTTIKKMFELIENIDTVVEKHKHFPEYGNHVIGVPIRFVLVPIKQFLDFDVEKLYLKLSKRVMDDFKAMLVRVQDIQVPGYIFKKVLEMNSSLAFILFDNQSEISREIRTYEEKLREIGLKYFTESVEILERYKRKEAKIDDLLKILNELKKECSYNYVFDQTVTFKENGEGELISIGHVNIEGSKSYYDLLTNRNSLRKFIADDEEKTKIWLHTNDKAPDGVFLTLDEMIESLKEKKVKVGKAVKSISTKFQLCVKVRGKEHISYNADEIPFVLSIIGAAVGVGSYNELLFHSMNAELMNIKLPLTNQNEVIDINYLIEKCLILKNIIITKSHFETWTLLTRNDNKWKFFMPIEAKQTSFLAFRYLHSLTSTFKDVDLIVGNLNNTDTATGFLFLIKNSKVKAVCLDDFDLILLKNKFINISESDLSILSPNNMKNSFFPLRAQSSEAVIKSIELHSYEDLNINDYGLDSFKENPNEELMNCLELACDLISSREINFIATIAKFAMQESNELKTILKKVGYSSTDYKFHEQSLYEKYKPSFIDSVAKIIAVQSLFSLKINIAIQVMNTVIEEQENPQKYEGKVSEVLKEIMGHQDCTEQLKNLIDVYDSMELKPKCTEIKVVLEEHVKKLVNGDQLFHTLNLHSVLISASKYHLIDILKIYINRISLKENTFGTAKKTFLEHLKNKDFNRLICLLSKCSVGEKYFVLHRELEKCCIHNRITAILSLLNQLTNNELFNNKTHWEDIWKNNRFQYIIRSGIDDLRVVNKLLQMGCQSDVPKYIPQDIARKINNLRENETEFELPDKFENFDVFAKELREMEIRNRVPKNFREVLIGSIEQNNSLYEKLENTGILDIFKWDFNSRLFRHCIVNKYIKEAVKVVDNLEKLSEQQEPIDVDPFDILFDQKPHIEKHNIDSNKLITIHENLISVYGNSISLIKYEEFIRLNRILDKPLLEPNDLQQSVVKILPYIIQKIKMWGCNVTTADGISSLIDIEIESNENANSTKTGLNSSRPRKNTTQNLPQKLNDENKIKFPLSRLDTITGVINSMDAIVSQDILNIMAKFPIALPLIIRELNEKDSYKNLIPWLTLPVIKWEASPGKMIENHLFVDKFKMIVCLRIGKCSDGRIGKSTILNQIFSSKNVFSCCGEPGAKTGKPVTLDGSVEFVWLKQETADSKLWESVLKKHYDSDKNEIILLANIHGNAIDFENHLKIFKAIASSYICFIMSEDNENFDYNLDLLEDILGIEESDKNVFYIGIDPSSEDRKMFKEDRIIDSSRISDDSNIEKLRNVLKNCLKNSGKKINMKDLQSIGKVKISELIETDESVALIEFIKKSSCKHVKKIMSLQSGNKTHVQCLEEWSKNDELQNVIKLMGIVLLLKEESRMKAMIHIENELSLISSNESVTARMKYYECLNQLQKASGDDLVMVADLSRDSREAIDEIDNTSLGLEHFYREIGKIYEIFLENRPEKNPYINFAKGYGELFARGQAIELLNGDSREILDPWLSAIFDDVYRKFPRIRVFVISILGLQSSGKSTLLNALFSCKFAVSVGRCTRGLFMRLLFLNEELKKELKFDAILLIDTEGLGAPERINDSDAERKDRIMATFAMCISHLTIVNVLGEYINNLTEILQIAIVAMAKLEKAEISPDILMVQHFTTERNEDKMIIARIEFSDALEKAIKITDEKYEHLGIKDSKCLKTLMSTISEKKLFCQFSPFKNGASAYSPPSNEYHQDIVKLREIILNIAEKSGKKDDLKDWQLLISSYWDRIKEENLMSLKDMIDLQTYCRRGEIMAEVKESIGSALRAHSELLKKKIADQAKEVNNKEVTRDSVKKIFKDKLKSIPLKCTSIPSCEVCKKSTEKQSLLYEFDAKRPSEKETSRKTVHNFTIQTSEWYYNELCQMFDSIAFQQIESTGIFEMIEERLKLLLRIKNNYSKDEIENEKKKLWRDLEKAAMDSVTQIPVNDHILDEISSVYKERPQFIENLEENIIENLRGIPAIERNIIVKGAKSVVKKIGFKVDPDSLEINYAYELEENIIGLSVIILKEEKAQNYQTGMIAILRRKVGEVIENFEKNIYNLKTDFKWKLHIFANQRFKKKMEEIQLKWDESYNPLNILHRNEAEYMSGIAERLKYGFGYDSEGLRIGQRLLLVIEQKALEAVNEYLVNDVLRIDWVSNSQSVRLKYFSELVERVKNNYFYHALVHFKYPKEQIEDWFKKKVDNFSEGNGFIKFEETFKSDLNRAKLDIENISNIKNIRDYVKENFSSLIEIELDKSIDIEKASKTNVEIFKNRILEVLNDKEKLLVITSKIKFTNPSSDERVMNRMGCNSACHFCSALCWGYRGHIDDEGEGSRHHTCHQPMGLSVVHGKFDHKLSCNSCDDQTDDHYWWIKEERMKWSTVKSLERNKTWKFETHMFNQFNDMMKWFFFKLNQDIAKNYQLEAPDIENIKKYGLDKIDIDSVMAVIKTKI